MNIKNKYNSINIQYSKKSRILRNIIENKYSDILYTLEYVENKSETNFLSSLNKLKRIEFNLIFIEIFNSFKLKIWEFFNYQIRAG
ncbi:hypothetical protein [Clostridium thermobutyricum]|uniref:hypothetical protein n=1 Tax=Clostridium thermobutyricum TaxID=29372 RepID=UPI0029437D31|nr:hypothetical protein [Clostridium thermobutyricum]